MITLRPYQEEGVTRALEHDGFGLFMEQRTGKTITALEITKRRESKRILVVCPKKALNVWSTWHQKMNLSSEIKVINFEQSWRQINDLVKYKADFLIVDESHRIKSRSSKQYRACRNLSKKIKYRLILTGTPMDKGTEDLYAQMMILNPNIFVNWEHFENRYLIMESVQYEGRSPFRKIVGYRRVNEIQEILDTYTYRVRRDEVSETPTRVIRRKVKVSLTKENRAHYYNLEKFLITEVKGKDVSTPHIITQILRLQQLCGGVLVDDDGQYHPVGTEKLGALEALLRDISDPVIVMARFHSEMDQIALLCDKLGKTHLEVSGRFVWKEGNKADVVVLQPQSGLAIDLSFSNTMIVFSQDYSFLNYSQSKDRIVQVGTEKVFYYFLLVEDSVDEIIYSSVTEKKKFTELVLDIYRNKEF